MSNVKRIFDSLSLFEMNTLSYEQWAGICNQLMSGDEAGNNSVVAFLQEKNFLKICISLLKNEMPDDHLDILLQVIREYVNGQWNPQNPDCTTFKNGFWEYLTANDNMNPKILALKGEILSKIVFMEWPFVWQDIVDKILDIPFDNPYAASLAMTTLGSLCTKIKDALRNPEVRSQNHIIQASELNQRHFTIKRLIDVVIPMLRFKIIDEDKNEYRDPLLIQFTDFCSKIAPVVDIMYPCDKFTEWVTDQNYIIALPCLAKTVLDLSEVGFHQSSQMECFKTVMRIFFEIQLSPEDIIQEDCFYHIFANYLPKYLVDKYESENFYDQKDMLMYIFNTEAHVMHLIAEKYAEGIQDFREPFFNLLRLFDKFYIEAIIQSKKSIKTLYDIIHDSIPIVFDSIVLILGSPYQIDTDLVDIEFNIDNPDSDFSKIAKVLVLIARFFPQMVDERIQAIYGELTQNSELTHEIALKLLHQIIDLITITINNLKGRDIEIIKNTIEWVMKSVVDTNADVYVRSVFAYYFAALSTYIRKSPHRFKLLDLLMMFNECMNTDNAVFQTILAKCLAKLFEIDYDHYEMEDIKIFIQMDPPEDSELESFSLIDAFRSIAGEMAQKSCPTAEKFVIRICNYVYFIYGKYLEYFNKNRAQTMESYEQGEKIKAEMEEFLVNYFGLTENQLNQSMSAFDINDVNSCLTLCQACKIFIEHEALKQRLRPFCANLLGNVYNKIKEIVEQYRLFVHSKIQEEEDPEKPKDNNQAIQSIKEQLETRESQIYVEVIDKLLHVFDVIMKTFDNNTIKELGPNYINEIVCLFVDPSDNFIPYYMHIPFMFLFLRNIFVKFKASIANPEIAVRMVSFALPSEIKFTCVNELFGFLKCLLTDKIQLPVEGSNSEQNELIHAIQPDMISGILLMTFTYCESENITVSKAAHKFLYDFLSFIDGLSKGFRRDLLSIPVPNGDDVIKLKLQIIVKILLLMAKGYLKFNFETYIKIMNLKFIRNQMSKQPEMYAQILFEITQRDGKQIESCLRDFVKSPTSSIITSYDVRGFITMFNQISHKDQDLQDDKPYDFNAKRLDCSRVMDNDIPDFLPPQNPDPNDEERQEDLIFTNDRYLM